jgi:hypothetical protein
MKYKIYGDRVKLLDSYLVSKSDFDYELAKMMNLHPTRLLWMRSERSLIREWASHNLAYNLGIKREKTKDCDLNFEQPWYTRLMYTIVGTIALWLIK